MASAERSSGLQLMVCRSVGISSLLSSWAATVQSTSGGGGEGGLVTGLGDPFILDTFETLLRVLGEVTFAIKDCVGDEYVGAVPSLGFFGSGAGGGGLTVASSCSSWGNDHHVES